MIAIIYFFVGEKQIPEFSRHPHHVPLAALGLGKRLQLLLLLRELYSGLLQLLLLFPQLIVPHNAIDKHGDGHHHDDRQKDLNQQAQAELLLLQKQLLWLLCCY